MGFRVRKSFKVMPGVRMTVSKSGVSASVGVRGARVTRTASGRVTSTVGIPGSGISHTSTLGGRSTRRRAAPTPPPRPPQAIKPGLTAPKWEKELHKAISSGDYSQFQQIANRSPDAAPPAAVLDGFTAFARGDHAHAKNALGWVWASGAAIEDNPFIRRYVSASVVTIGIAEGVDAALPLTRDAVGLALAELHQEDGDLAAAIDVVEQLDPSLIAALSLAELYLDAGRYNDVIDITNGTANTDDATALLVTFRGAALAELGHHTAAREALKEALKSRSRHAAIRHRALIERAKSHLADGSKAQARKDLERILAEDAAYPEVRAMLSAL